MPQEYDGPERRTTVSQRECDKTHLPINTFMTDTKTSIETLHEKMNANKNLLIGTLITAIFSLCGILVELIKK